MNRRATLITTSGLLALAIAALATPAAGAFPIRDFSPTCPGQSTLAYVDVLDARYARYLSPEELQASDANDNGTLCVVKIELDAGSPPLPIDAPILYGDDRG
jgi:hypothetical protein